MSEEADARVRRYFDRGADRFDLIYRGDKGPLQRLTDRLFRGVVRQRFELILTRCGDVGGRRVLDVGCGSGRYSVELARRGAEVVGIDPAPAMIRIATAAAGGAGVGDRCRFVQADFLSWQHPEPFDIGLAIGLFDYVELPERFVSRLAGHVHGRVFCSFPVRWTARTPTRWLRLRLNGCPVHFYDRHRVESLFAPPEWAACRVDRLSRDYLLEARTAR
jgi:2-polyprenyl-3-methyl-5-hydroxy-6-metoxy-1,4-benzoquinol methylase